MRRNIIFTSIILLFFGGCTYGQSINDDDWWITCAAILAPADTLHINTLPNGSYSMKITYHSSNLTKLQLSGNYSRNTPVAMINGNYTILLTFRNVDSVITRIDDKYIVETMRKMK